MKITVPISMSPHSTIYIIGNGVIAKALAVSLLIEGKNVVVLRGSVDGQAASLQTVKVETNDAILQADVPVSSISNYQKLNGIILLTNKAFGNAELAVKLAGKTGQSPIVFLQNGLNVEKSFVEQGFDSLYRCVLFATSESAKENTVKFKLVAPSPVGTVNGSKQTLPDIVALLNTKHFPFRKEEDIQTLIWKKVISNCVFNSLCPLLETDNGVFHRNESALGIAEKIIAECLTVAKGYGINLTQDDVLQNVLMISRSSDGQKISTYQDILNKRQTEIDSFNFAVAQAGLSKGNISVPLTSLLGDLVKIKSDLSRSIG